MSYSFEVYTQTLKVCNKLQHTFYAMQGMIRPKAIPEKEKVRQQMHEPLKQLVLINIFHH